MEQLVINVTEKMLSVGQPVAQGEVYIWMAKYAPEEVKKNLTGEFKNIELEEGQLILGHSETGHNHVLEPTAKSVPVSKAAQALIDSATELWCDLKLTEPCALIHQKTGPDAHRTLTFPAGEYIVRTRQEQTPNGWQKSLD